MGNISMGPLGGIDPTTRLTISGFCSRELQLGPLIQCNLQLLRRVVGWGFLRTCLMLEKRIISTCDVYM